MKGEVWEEIPGFNGKYFVSNMGRVIRIKRYGGKRRYSSQMHPKEIYPLINEYGSSRVALRFPDGRRTDRSVRRLVAELFMGATRGDKIIHRDGDPYNCKVNNLRLSSMKKSQRFNQYMLDYCYEQHHEHDVSFMDLAERFVVGRHVISYHIAKERRRRGRSKQVEDERGASGSREAEDNGGVDSSSGENQKLRKTFKRGT